MDRPTRPQPTEPSTNKPSAKPKRPWRAPEIVKVGGVLDLTEAVTTNVNDGSSASMVPTYRP
jgi:hypothetical protein